MRSLITSALFACAIWGVAPAASQAQWWPKRVEFTPEDYPKFVVRPAVTETVTVRTTSQNVYTPVESPPIPAQNVYAPIQRAYTPLVVPTDIAPTVPVPRVSLGVRVYVPYQTFNPDYYPWIYRVHNYPRYPMTWPW